MADSLVGKELVFLMKQNRNLLVYRYENKKVVVVDNLDKVPSSEFIDQNWTTEHYSESGRKIIAHSVSQSLKLFHSKLYKGD